MDAADEAAGGGQQEHEHRKRPTGSQVCARDRRPWSTHPPRGLAITHAVALDRPGEGPPCVCSSFRERSAAKALPKKTRCQPPAARSTRAGACQAAPGSAPVAPRRNTTRMRLTPAPGSPPQPKPGQVGPGRTKRPPTREAAATVTATCQPTRPWVRPAGLCQGMGTSRQGRAAGLAWSPGDTPKPPAPLPECSMHLLHTWHTCHMWALWSCCCGYATQLRCKGLQTSTACHPCGHAGQAH